MQPILVTGATGTLGRPLVEALTGEGQRVRALSRRPTVHLRLPGATVRGFRAGGHLCPEHADGRQTWEEFLAAATATAVRSAPARARRGP